MRKALADGQTNYPPSDGVIGLREAVARYYGKHLGLSYPVESVLITGGARPLLYGSYRTVLDPGDAAVYPVPSWNNNHYSYLCGARAGRDPGARRDQLLPHAGGARGRTWRRAPAAHQLAAQPDGHGDRSRRSCSASASWSSRRTGGARGPAVTRARRSGSATTRSTGSWCLGGARATSTPPEVCAEVAPYTIILDAASKSFAATGLRVGWAVMPPAARQRMADILGHVGAWAPRPEQVAMAALLDDERGGDRPTSSSSGRACASGSTGWRPASRPWARRGRGRGHRAAGGDLSVGALSDPRDRPTRRRASCCSSKAGFAVVPFQAFGLREDSGWFRISVGAVSLAEIDAALPRVRAALLRRWRRCRRARAPGLALARPSSCATLFPFAENKHGDAPMRALVAERMVLEPASAADPAHLLPVRAAAHRAHARRSSRSTGSPRARRAICLFWRASPSFFPFLAARGRLVGRPRAALAAFALAVSPLHLQASTTAASEALYLLLWVAALERLLARARAPPPGGTSPSPASLASLAAVTRYDAWLALPLWSRWPLASSGPRGRARCRRAGWRCSRSSAAAAAGDLARLGRAATAGTRCSSRTTSRPTTAGWRRRRRALRRRARARCASSGSGRSAFVAAMTPPRGGARGASRSAGAGARSRRPMRLVVVAAPRAARALSRAGSSCRASSRWPASRSCPGTLLLPLAASAVRARARPRRFGPRRRRVGGAVLDRRVAGRDRRPRAASGPAPSRWARSRASTARIARSPTICGPTGAPGAPRDDRAHRLRRHRHRSTRRASLGRSRSRSSSPASLATVAETLRATGAFLVGYDREGGWPTSGSDWPADDSRLRPTGACPMPWSSDDGG